MQDNILEKALKWSNEEYFDACDRKIISDLLENKEENSKELTEMFYKDLEFGTGGLRSILGMGSNRMNKYNVRKATQAMANVIKSKNIINASACVSFDSRRFSPEFAKEVASVFAGNGIKAYIYDQLTPVPMLSFATRFTKSSAGVMVTASHNPKDYNGFKAFWGQGAQVTPPEDGQIIKTYENIKNWNEILFLDFEKGLKNKMISYIGEDVKEAYYQILENRIQNLDMCKKDGEKLNVVYTAIHGTGEKTCTLMAERLGFTSFQTVKDQAQPDFNFPTVKSPNPENPDALHLAVEQMKATNADMVYGTDPDTDRLGVAYLVDGEVKYLNGNQIAVLMLYYITLSMSDNKKLTSKSVVFKSIVTSELQTRICEHYNVEMVNTLTGFKWMGQVMNKWDDEGREFDFVFASEESFGYMGHADVRDKDGVCAVIQMLELSLYYKLKGQNFDQALDAIYNQYGYYYESLLCLDYFGKEGGEKIDRIMNFFREQRPTEICGEEITEVEDYKPLTLTNLKTNEERKLTVYSSNVLGFTFSSGNKLYLRPSGTEPKIKFYAMVNSSEGTLEERKIAAVQKTKDIESYIQKICKDL
jgi:phosphoglucomutase